jgi:hypothetical protein
MESAELHEIPGRKHYHMKSGLDAAQHNRSRAFTRRSFAASATIRSPKDALSIAQGYARIHHTVNKIAPCGSP